MCPSRPPARTLLALACALLALALVPASAAADCTGADSLPSADIPRAEQATVCLINLERTSRGLQAVLPNESLSRASVAHAEDMVTRLFFGHVAPGGVTLVERLLQAGYMLTGERWLAGETLGWGETWKGRPREIVRAWMNSPTHRAVILTPAFSEVGIGIVKGLPMRSLLSGVTYASEFAWRKPQLKVLPARFATAPRRAAAAARARRGTRFEYMLSEPANVRLAIRRAVPGRRRGSSCVSPRSAPRRAASCRRHVSAGAVRGTGTTGPNTVPFDGWIGRKRLLPGSYEVTLTATDLDDGSVAPQTTARFRIVRR